MTYNPYDPNNPNNPNNPNDPNNLTDRNVAARNRRAVAGAASYTGWVIGGVVALVVILGFVFLLPTNNSNIAGNDNYRNSVSSPARPAAPLSSTTGSGATSPQPATPAPATRPKQ